MYPKNLASPPKIFATVVKASDGTAITTSVAAKYSTGAGSQASGGGTCQHEGNGQWSYAPTQGETNVTAFGIQFYHADAVGSGPTVSVVTTTVNATTSLPSVDVGGISGDTTAADNCEAFFDGTGYAGGTAKLTVDLVKINGTAVTGTGTRVADAFTSFFNVATPALTVACVNQTGDSYAIVSHTDYGNAKLVRSVTPANALTVDANNLAVANVSQWASSAVSNHVVTGYPNVNVYTFADNSQQGSMTNLIDFFDATGWAGGTAKLGVNLVQINGHAIPGTSNQVADGFEYFFNVATPGQTVAATGIKADVTAISGDTTAADDFETMLDGTGGKTLTLGQLRINAAVAGGGIDIDNSSGPAIDARGTIGFYVEGSGASNYGIEAVGTGATDSGGIKASATTAGEGFEGHGAGNGHGMYVIGAGSGEGIHATAGGGANGHGVHFEGIGANSHGMLLSRGGSGGDDLRFANNDCTIPTVTTLNGLAATALADFFDTDSGKTYALAVAGSVVKEIADNAGGSALTEEGIADAVWDELLAGHADPGSAGEALSAAGTAGDPWITELPGAYGDGTAGQILGDMPLALDDTLSDIHTDLTTVLDRIGAFLGSGTNTILGFFRALFRKDVSAPSDVGGTFDPTSDSQEASAEAQAVIDGNVDLILSDTGTDGVVVASASKTGYALTSAYDAAKTAASQTSVDTVATYIDTEVAAIKAVTDVLISPNTIADAVLKRDVDQVEATAAADSLGGMILATFHSNTVDNPGHWTIYRTNDSTVFTTWAQTTDAAAAPTTGISTNI
jgi:hypothetical protein